MGWNPWHGCRKLSQGCANCFVYATDLRYGRNTEVFSVNKELDKPLRRNKKGEYFLMNNPMFLPVAIQISF